MACIPTLPRSQASHKWQRALDVLAAMLQSGPLPNVISYNATITACGNVQQWERALAVFNLLLPRSSTNEYDADNTVRMDKRSSKC